MKWNICKSKVSGFHPGKIRHSKLKEAQKTVKKVGPILEGKEEEKIKAEEILKRLQLLIFQSKKKKNNNSQFQKPQNFPNRVIQNISTS